MISSDGFWLKKKHLEVTITSWAEFLSVDVFFFKKVMSDFRKTPSINDVYIATWLEATEYLPWATGGVLMIL